MGIIGALLGRGWDLRSACLGRRRRGSTSSTRHGLALLRPPRQLLRLKGSAPSSSSGGPAGARRPLRRCGRGHTSALWALVPLAGWLGGRLHGHQSVGAGAMCFCHECDAQLQRAGPLNVSAERAQPAPFRIQGSCNTWAQFG